ncbi:hypothetical protein LXA44_17690, partial [Erwinia amylovora]|nr:hypothetical protein [Erwinia amylovora]
PAVIASQMGHQNAEMVYAVYSAWLNALDGDQIEFLNQRIGGVNAPIALLHVNAVWLSYCF